VPPCNYQRSHSHIFQNSDFCQKYGIHSKISRNKFKYSRTRLKRHRFKRHLIYNVRRSVVPNNSSLLTITLYSSVITRLVYNDTKYSFRDVITKFDCILLVWGPPATGWTRALTIPLNAVPSHLVTFSSCKYDRPKTTRECGKFG
jgi:hypothetical protein